MLLGHVPLLLVFLKVPEYVRDALQLPLMGPRILYIDLYLLLLGIVLCQIENARINGAGLTEWRATRESAGWLCVFALFLLTLFIITLAREEEFFFVLQFASFVLSFYYLQLVTLTRVPRSLFNAFNAVLALCALLQFTYWLGGALGMPSNADLLGRNHLPYVALSVFAVAMHLGERSTARQALVLAVVLTLINSTKGAFVLLAVLLLLRPVDRLLGESRVIRSALATLLILVGVLSPVILFQAALSYTGIAMRDLLEFESQRYFISDNYGSLISRTISVILTVQATLDNGDLLGLGLSRASQLLFFGYPVHNYLVSSIAVVGVVGLALDLALLLMFSSLARRSIALALFGIYLLTAANDIYMSMTLLLLPIMLLHRPVAARMPAPAMPLPAPAGIPHA